MLKGRSMREPVHDTVIKFRANAALAQGLREMALRQHRTPSEIMREAVREKVNGSDVGLSGRGDSAALRRMRDRLLELASGDVTNPLLPKFEAQAQAELLAEMAAGSGEAADLLALLVAYQIRTETLEHNRAAAEDMAKEAVEANNISGLDHWTSCVVDTAERLGCYRSKMDELLTAIFGSGNASGSAMMVKALSIQADRGDELAATVLQAIIDSVPPERAKAIQAEVRKLESEGAQ